MTHKDYESIAQMRAGGMTFAAIAEALGMSLNTAKSIWRRYAPKPNGAATKCKLCGAELCNAPKVKPKQFCSAKCRSRWWYVHRGDSPTLPRLSCICCGNSFAARGNQKYCSRACYLNHTRRKTDGQGNL